MKLDSVAVANYRCFSSEPQGLSGIGGLNLIIGRNNSGKSRLLDLVRYLCDQKSIPITDPAFIRVSGFFEAKDLEAQFSRGRVGGDIPGNHWEYAQRFVGVKFRYDFRGNSILATEIDAPEMVRPARNRLETVIASYAKPLSGKTYIHIAAERSIQSEQASEAWISPSGEGATAVIQRFLSRADLSSDLIEVELLAELNAIFEPDNRFSRILVQQLGDGRWEIYLEEDEKGRIPLSSSGSGLQTILLILLAIHTIPAGKKLNQGDLVVAIEEPENNLHPALQRRLLAKLEQFSRRHGAIFFITTHSTVAIDQFVGQEATRLFHVRHDGKFAKVGAVQAYADGHEILRDLDVRASDLLQSNGIIWVEGPTDRLYLNKWIEVASGGRIREGAHYQCVFYGGKLLSHLSVDGDLSLRKELIDLITINKNAAILIDSDRRSDKGRLNATKTRIRSEFEKIGAFVWVTKGREIENYIAQDLLGQLFSAEAYPGKLESVKEWISGNKRRKKVAPDKITLASKIVGLTANTEHLEVLDLRDQIDQLIQKISHWNNLRTSAK